MADIENYKLPDKAPELPQSKKSKRKPEEDTWRSEVPASPEAEKTILGAILLSNEAYLEVSERLIPDDFSLDSHQRIFQRMTDLISDHRAIDIVTLGEELAKNKEISTVGGVAYLASLTEGLPRRPVIDEYIRIVKDKSLLRQLMALSSSTIARAVDQSETALEVATWHAANLQEIIEGGTHRGLIHASDLSVEVMDRFVTESVLTTSPGFGFGIPNLDLKTGGLMPGEQCVIGAYSSVGKTTLLAQIVAANCGKGHPMALFLFEPTRHSFLRRLWSIVARMDDGEPMRYEAVTKPWLATKAERDKLLWAESQVAEWPLFINDLSNTFLDEQIAQTRMAMHREGIELTAIDYIQRMKVRAQDKFEDMRLKIGRASTENANLVKNTKNRTVILSQLRRGGIDSIPTIEQLRESGQLENDAATIVLLHLTYDAELGHFTNEGAAIVAKQRYGIPCNVELKKHPRSAMWVDKSFTGTFTSEEDEAAA